MTMLDVTADMERDPWTDYADGREVTGGRLTRIGVLRQGMDSGRASIALAVELPNGSVVLAETSLRLFHIAAKAVLATPIASEEPLDD